MGMHCWASLIFSLMRAIINTACECSDVTCCYVHSGGISAVNGVSHLNDFINFEDCMQGRVRLMTALLLLPTRCKMCVLVDVRGTSWPALSDILLPRLTAVIFLTLARQRGWLVTSSEAVSYSPMEEPITAMGEQLKESRPSPSHPVVCAT